MKTKILYGFLISLLFLGCQKEDELSPSYADINWFAVEDDPNNALTHLRYSIFIEQGVPIFYNDTLGSETRYDRNGNPFTYYEVLNPGYTVTGSSKPKYSLSYNEEDVLDMVELMNEYLFDYLPRERYPLSYLLVDTMFGSLGTNVCIDNYYKSLNTVCVGKLREVKQMSDSARKSAMAELAGLHFVDDVLNSEANELLRVQYDSVILRVKFDNKVYQPYQFNYGASYGTRVTHKIPKAEEFGILYYRFRTDNMVFAPTRQQDKAGFIGLILSCTDAEIRERYKDSPLVIQKYEMMREMMENLGMLKE